MVKHFPIPHGADEKSVKAIKAFEAKLGHMTIPDSEIEFIVAGVMKQQIPRDQERARKAEEKRKHEADKLRRMAEARRRRY